MNQTDEPAKHPIAAPEPQELMGSENPSATPPFESERTPETRVRAAKFEFEPVLQIALVRSRVISPWSTPVQTRGASL